jgi:hypothetical protein
MLLGIRVIAFSMMFCGSPMRPGSLIVLLSRFSMHLLWHEVAPLGFWIDVNTEQTFESIDCSIALRSTRIYKHTKCRDGHSTDNPLKSAAGYGTTGTLRTGLAFPHVVTAVAGRKDERRSERTCVVGGIA